MTNPQDDFQDDDEYDRPSKTQKKKESHELQSLGEDLLTLPADRVAPLNLPEILLDAVKAARKISNFEGKRRQMQYIGKLMRRNDVEPIREAVAAMQLGQAKDSLALHEAERWRAELIAGDDALTLWLQAHPDTDSQQLRSLVRAARRDAAGLAPEARQPKSFRDLFQFIKPKLCPPRSAFGASPQGAPPAARRSRFRGGCLMAPRISGPFQHDVRPRSHRPGLGQRPRLDGRVLCHRCPGRAFRNANGVRA